MRTTTTTTTTTSAPKHPVNAGKVKGMSRDAIALEKFIRDRPKRVGTAAKRLGFTR